jgi:hypothetical protein
MNQIRSECKLQNFVHINLTVKVEIEDSVLEHVYICVSFGPHDVFHHVQH